MSHKIDIIERKGEFNRKVEAWLTNVSATVPDESRLPLSESFSVRPTSAPACESGEVISASVGAVVDDCDRLGSEKSCGLGSYKSSSTHSSRASRIKESRVKVRLAQLALRHEEERQQEEEKRRQQAKREKERELEMAKAELEAWEEESVCGVEKGTIALKQPITALSKEPVTPIVHTSNNGIGISVTELKHSRTKMDSAKRVVELNEGNYFSQPNRSFSVQHGVGRPRDVESVNHPKIWGKEELWSQPMSSANMKGPREHGPTTGRELQFQSHGSNYPYDGTFRTVQHSPLPSYAEVGERFLPKPAIEKFEGDPLDYWAFVNRFKVHIADRIRSDDLKLVYLLQHCSKTVYERIQHYASGPDKHRCYEMVWRELFERYGQPHIISRYCEQRLQELPRVGQYDFEGLEKMAVLMKRCLAALDEFTGHTTMNTVGFISMLAEKLPVELRRRWITQAR